MPTQHPRIQVTEDPELARALEAAAPYLPEGLSRAGLVRELALNGARQITGGPTEAERRALLERHAKRYEDPDSFGIDWDLLRDKRNAWPIRH